MTQPYGFGQYGPNSIPEVRADQDDSLSLEAAHDGTVASVDEIMRGIAGRILWEIVWSVLDPDGSLTNAILTRVIDHCRESMQHAADVSIISEEPEVVNQIKNMLDHDIREGARFFLQAYMTPLTTQTFRDTIVDNLRKRLTDGAPPAK